MSLLGSRKKCYCAFCKSERMVYTKRRINFFNIFAAALASILSMLAIWQNFDPRMLLFFVVYLAMAEAFVQIRWRLNIVCKFCGFDPVLYLRDSNKAALKVKQRLEERDRDPASILKAPLNIPFVKKKKEATPHKGHLVSKEI